MTKSALEYEADGKRAFTERRYAAAADSFREASRLFVRADEGLRSAEMDNNLSVALLKNKHPREALEAAQGTQQVFAAVGDKPRQGMALGNQGAALEDLKQYAEAIALYEQAAALFEESAQGDMQSLALKSIASIRLKQGQLNTATTDMLGSLAAVDHPTVLQRITRFILRFLP